MYLGTSGAAHGRERDAKGKIAHFCCWFPATGKSVLAEAIRQRVPRWVYFVLFTVSGFSGLIYESI